MKPQRRHIKPQRRRRRDAQDVDSELARTVVEGRSAGTPFVLLGSVALVIWTVAAVIAGVAVLVWWLS